MEWTSVLLEGRSALVTGGGRGIGAAIARRFAAEGAGLVLCGRSGESEAVADEIGRTGGRAVGLRGDVREEAFVKELVRACRREHQHLDVLVNNAGIMKESLIGMMPSEQIREQFEVNIFAPIHLVQYAIRIMARERRPTIVNV